VELLLIAALPETEACLAIGLTEIPKITLGNEKRAFTLSDVPNGSYRLMIGAATAYLRQPAGYTFQIEGGKIVHRPDLLLAFELIPPSAQALPPCRVYEAALNGPPDSRSDVEDTSIGPGKDVCQAEPISSISAPPKQPHALRDQDYIYLGPQTPIDTQGLRGRNTVVDTNIPHYSGQAPNRFVAERVYAQGPDNGWMEAGWAEMSWEPEGQYVYQYNSAHATWELYPEYTLVPGSKEDFDVQYEPATGQWKARYYLGGNEWRVLARANLGFNTADKSYNRGELYTEDGTFAILPKSEFDQAHLLIGGVWRLWDNRYWSEVFDPPPYECDMLANYHRFVIYSPHVYLPLSVKSVQ
jgi:hypothetical protein